MLKKILATTALTTVLAAASHAQTEPIRDDAAVGGSGTIRTMEKMTVQGGEGEVRVIQGTSADPAAPMPVGVAEDGVAENLGDAADATADAAGGAADAVTETAGDAADTAVDATGIAADAVGDAASDVGSATEEAAEETGDAVSNATENAEAAAENAGEAVEETAQDAGQALENTAEGAAEATDDAGEAVEETAEDAEQAIEGTVTEADPAMEDTGAATDAAATDGAMDSEPAEVDAAAVETDVDEVPPVELSPELAEQGFVLMDLPSVTSEALTGADVRNIDGDEIATVDNVIMSTDGRVESVVAKFGGFLGFGTSKVILALDEVNIVQDGDGNVVVMTELTPDDLEGRPEFDG